MNVRLPPLVALALLALPGCTSLVEVDHYTFDVDPCGPPPPTCEGGRELIFIVSAGDIVRPVGTALDGFDLDATDESICRIRDTTSPSGVPGIDNQLSALGRIYESATGENITELTREQILLGVGLNMVVVGAVDDLVNDNCITIEQRRARPGAGLGLSDLDADGDGVVDAGLAFDYGLPAQNDQNACIIDGVIHARYPDSVNALPFGPVGNEFTSRRGRSTVRIDESGLYDGLLGGSADVEALINSLVPDPAAADQSLIALLRSYADLDPSRRDEDDCTSLSYALTYAAVPAVKGAFSR